MKIGPRLLLDAIKWDGTAEAFLRISCFGARVRVVAPMELWLVVNDNEEQVPVGDWIIRFANGSFDWCDQEYFDRNYEIQEEKP